MYLHHHHPHPNRFETNIIDLANLMMILLGLLLSLVFYPWRLT
jgi:hypothetical protein